jgi:transcriptional regulator with XRE-family HTH domain
MRTRDFPGIDAEKNATMAREVEEDESSIVEALSRLRRENAISLETLAYVLGTSGGHVSKYLTRGASISLINYLRIARALGYRCRIKFEKVDEGGAASLNKVAYRHMDVRRSNRG